MEEVQRKKVEDSDESQAIRDPVLLRVGQEAEGGRWRTGLMDVEMEDVWEKTVAALLSTTIKT